MEYKQNELPVFIEKIKELVAEQRKEIEQAVFNHGKYQFRSPYQFLEVDEAKWFSMNSQQRSKHLLKVHSSAVSDGEGMICKFLLEMREKAHFQSHLCRLIYNRLAKE